MLSKVGGQISQYEGQEWSVTILKDLIYDIDEKI